MKYISSYIAVFLAVFLEILVAMWIMGFFSVSVATAAIFHILSSLLAALSFYHLYGRSESKAKRGNIWWIYALTCTLAMPVYGILSIVIIYFMERKMKRRPPPIMGDDITVPDEEVFRKPLTKTRQLEVLERIDVEPFVDILKHGRSALKRGAIQFLSAMPSRESIKMLGLAVMDDDIEVRLYAAGVMGLVDDNFTREIDAFKSEFNSNPGNVSVGIELADVYFAYASSGLLDDVVSGYYYNEALNILLSLPGSEKTLYQLARTYFAMGRNEEAESNIEKCVEIEGANKQYLRLRCEIKFAMRKYDELINEYLAMRENGMIKADDPSATFWI